MTVYLRQCNEPGESDYLILFIYSNKRNLRKWKKEGFLQPFWIAHFLISPVGNSINFFFKIQLKYYLFISSSFSLTLEAPPTIHLIFFNWASFLAYWFFLCNMVYISLPLNCIFQYIRANFFLSPTFIILCYTWFIQWWSAGFSLLYFFFHPH